MKILYISESFSPVSKVAAIRNTKLPKYLSRRGHEVTVLARDWGTKLPFDSNLIKDEQEIPCVLRVRNSVFYTKVYNKVYSTYKKSAISTEKEIDVLTQKPAGRKKKSWKYQVKKVVREWMEMWENLDYAKQGEKVLSQIGDQQFDVVISSYGPFSSHILGLYAKRKYNCRWIADFRDPVFYTQGGSVLSGWARRFRDRSVRHADHITAVSEGCLFDIREEGRNKSTIITNGFDPEDCNPQATIQEPDGIFRLAYTGQLYIGERESALQPIFRALKELENEGKLDLGKVEIHYAGPSSDECLRQAVECGVEHCLIDHGFITRDEALALQGKSNVLLLASWNSVGHTGVVTGKVFEYFMSNKPIVCTVSGNLPGSILKQMIHDANAGFCYEEVAKEEDFPGLKEELLKQYQIAIGEAENDFSLNQEYVMQFTYASKAAEFEKLLR